MNSSAPPLTRRAWLAWVAQTCAGLAASSLMARPLFAKNESARDLLVGAYSRETARDKALGNFVTCTDLSTGEFKRVATEFLPHSIVPFESTPSLVLAIGKRVDLTSLINLNSGRVEESFPSREGTQFYGHAAFSRDQKLLFTAEVGKNSPNGVLQIRDGKTFKPISSFPTHGMRPHDLRISDDGKSAFIGNAGSNNAHSKSPAEEKTCITHVDLASGRLLERISGPINHGVGYELSHVLLTSDQQLFTSTFPQSAEGRYYSGMVFKTKEAGTLKELLMPGKVREQFCDQALSMAVDESRSILGVSGVKGNCVLFWNYRTEKFLKKVDCDFPCGLVLNRERTHFLTSSRSGAILRIQADSLELENWPGIAPVGPNSGHMRRILLPT